MPRPDELEAALRVVESEVDRRWPMARLVKNKYKDAVRQIVWKALAAAEQVRHFPGRPVG